MIPALLIGLLCHAGGLLQEAPDWADLADRGQWAELLEQAEARLELAPGDVMAQAWLGRASHQRGLELARGDDFARDLGQALVRRAVEVLDVVQEHGAEAPDASWEWWVEARLDVEGADLSGLAEELERSWEGGSARRAGAARLRARLATRRGEAEQVLWWSRAQEASPGRSDVALALAEAEASAGDRARALAAWDLAAQATGVRVPPLLAALLTILPAREDSGERLQRLERLAETAAPDERVLVAWHRAYALDQLGRPAEAAEAFAAMSPGLDPAFDRAHALLLQRLGRPAEAVELLRPLVAARDWEAFSQLIDVADGLATDRRWEESLALYDLAMQVEPRDERLVRNRALTLWRAGRLEASRVAWEGVLALFPGRADILNDAALERLAAGDRAAARSLFEAASALPGSEDARENLALLLLEDDPADVEAARRLLDQVLATDPHRDRALVLRYGTARSGP